MAGRVFATAAWPNDVAIVTVGPRKSWARTATADRCAEPLAGGGAALRTIRAIEPYGVYFVEAPFPPDNLDAYARLAECVDTRIAMGDWGCTTRFEFEEIMQRGRVDVVQPSSVRSGGIAEILTHRRDGLPARADLCPACLVPHGGRGGRSPPGGCRAQYALFRVPYRLPRFAGHLRIYWSRCLEPDADGTITVPQRPGLGFRLNEAVVRDYRVEPH